MFSIGMKLFTMCTQKGDDAGTISKPTFGRAIDPSEKLSAMSAALPDEENKWQLTNIGGIGSDEDKQLREQAAESEAEFEGAGQEPGLEIWRIEKFTPQRVNVRADNLSFYSGDSYIVLKTIRKEGSDALDWQIHYWIGKDSTQDESGSAAYFTVNLDDLLEQKPVQHRELQYSESKLFQSYFRSVTYLDGGIDTGFKKVEAEVYKPRLLQMTCMDSFVRVMQVPLSASSLNTGDVFILDNGLTLYQFNSEHASGTERRRAMEIVQGDIRPERDYEAELTILDGDEVFSCEPFWELLGGKVDQLPDVDESERDISISNEVDFSAPKKLFKISNETGALVLSAEKEDDSLSPDDVNDHDAWAVACDNECFIYRGAATNKDEKFYVCNNCDAIVRAMGLDDGAQITFFSKDSDSTIWNQLFG